MTNSSRLNAPSFNSTHRAVRVTLSYQGRDLRLGSRKVLSMRTPPSELLDVPERRTGFWFQVEDVNGRPLYRRRMHNPIQFDTEIPSEESARPLKRMPLSEPQGTFFILVPDLPQAHTVRIFSSPPEPGEHTRAAEEIIRFDIINDFTGERAVE